MTRHLLLAVSCLALLACGSASSPGEDEAFETPEGTWTFVPVEGTQCGNGTTAGVGVNLGARRDQVFIYLQGGGACWDALTCLGLPLATRINETYGQAAFDEDVGTLQATGMLDRNDPANPFREASWIFVPYCTGDLHAGHSSKAYNPLQPDRMVHHRGGDNLTAFLARMEATFEDPERVWLAGSSAGGFGAQLNFDEVQRSFPDTQLHVLADSAQPVDPEGELWGKLQEAWSVKFPEGCEGCETSAPALLDFLATRHPDARVGLLAYERDSTLSPFFGLSAEELQSRTRALVAAQAGRANFRSFVLPDAAHVMLDSYLTLTAPDATPLRTWVNQWATGDAAWKSAP